jgi:hypothetical protein
MTFIIGTPHRHNEGYICTQYSAHHAKREGGIQSCTHCQAVVELKGAEDWCPKCDAVICPSCAFKMPTQGCTPFIKQVEQALEVAYRRSQLRKILGT